MSFESEKECCDLLVNRLRAIGYSVAREVPFYLNAVDVVAYRDGKVIAIEVKLQNYRRAIHQAKNHCLFADEVYVALPEGKAMSLDWDNIENQGVGLIAVGTDVHFIRSCIFDIEPVTRHTQRVLEHCHSINGEVSCGTETDSRS